MNITIISDSLFDRIGSSTQTLAKALSDNNHNVYVILPFYEKYYTDSSLTFGTSGSFFIKLPQGNFSINLYCTKKDGITYYFIANNKTFARERTWGYHDDAVRISVFCTAAIEMLLQSDIKTEYILTDSPNTALVPVLLKFKYHTKTKARSINSFHYVNTSDYGIYDKTTATAVFGLSPEEKHFLICNNEVNLTKAAIVTASRVFVGEKAISILYDRNNDIHHTAIQFGFKIRKLRLGIDYSVFSPDRDPDIHKCYSYENISNKTENKLFVQKYLYLNENEDIPIVAMYPDGDRDMWHKYAKELIRCDIQIIIISNNVRNTDMPTITEKCVCIQDRSAETLKNIYSASDFCIFGGLGSECGNPAFISAAYGCVPILPSHRFFDFGFSYFNKLTLDGNGYTYDPNIKKDMMYTLWDALGIYRHDKRTYYKLLQNTMKKVYSASDSIKTIEKETEKTNYSFI